jgi:hypothetical protein
MALDSQTDSVKKNRIRLSVVNPSAVGGSKWSPSPSHHHSFDLDHGRHPPSAVMFRMSVLSR